MFDRDILLQKVNSIQKYIATIDKATENDHDKLSNQIIQDAVVLNLQRAIQLCIDMGTHLVTSLHWELPSSFREIFIILQRNDVINEELATKMIGFRNIAVHDYQKINLNILKKIIIYYLSDFEQFYSSVLEYCDQLAS